VPRPPPPSAPSLTRASARGSLDISIQSTHRHSVWTSILAPLPAGRCPFLLLLGLLRALTQPWPFRRRRRRFRRRRLCCCAGPGSSSAAAGLDHTRPARTRSPAPRNPRMRRGVPPSRLGKRLSALAGATLCVCRQCDSVRSQARQESMHPRRSSGSGNEGFLRARPAEVPARVPGGIKGGGIEIDRVKWWRGTVKSGSSALFRKALVRGMWWKSGRAHAARAWSTGGQGQKLQD